MSSISRGFSSGTLFSEDAGYPALSQPLPELGHSLRSHAVLGCNTPELSDTAGPVSLPHNPLRGA